MSQSGVIEEVTVLFVFSFPLTVTSLPLVTNPSLALKFL